MNKLLYLTMSKIDLSSGVYKKIRAQAEAFEKEGFETRILFVSDGQEANYLKNNEVLTVNLQDILSEVTDYLKECYFCYVRFELLRHKNFKNILERCLQLGTKIVTEIPTFPPYQESMARFHAKIRSRNYVGAMKTFIGAGLVFIDMNLLAQKSNMVCIVADDYQFKGTKTIRIENGIDLRNNPYSAYIPKECVNIIAVSNFTIWNGYDRAIEGLYIYKNSNPSKKIKLILVGPLENAPELQKRVEELDLEDWVEFTGALSGKELDSKYAQADIALCALGNHRRKVFANSSLKAKEYAARGMLMVLSDAEGIEQEIVKNSFVVKSDETPIDFVAIVDWFEKISDKEKIKNSIHYFAIRHYSWDYQIKKILDEFDNI